jgi:hypothetical protein
MWFVAILDDELVGLCSHLDTVTADYGRRCLMTRQLIEAGVLFVHVEAPARSPWDSHSNLKGGMEQISAKVDRPSAALIRDLKRRGLLDETIVIWGGEFGRLPVSQNGNGRPQPARLLHPGGQRRLQGRSHPRGDG